MADTRKKNTAFSSADSENLEQVQLELLLLLHAHKCQRPECKYSHCKTASNILSHMKTCTSGELVCKFSHCRSSRRLINHWRHCAPTGRCKLCLPLHKLSTNDYTSLFKISQQSSTLAVGPSTSRDDKEVAEPSTSRGDPQQRKHSKFEGKKQQCKDSKGPTTSTDDKEATRPSISERKQKSITSNDSTTSFGADKASGIINNKIGIDYHFFVAMYLCLHGYKTKQSNSSYKFTIRQESKGVGMFDDIVYKYRQNESEEWTRLLIQIKYKQADNKIKTGNLLYDDKKETFSLIKFMKSTKQIEDTKNCFFIIFTSAALDLEDDGRLRQWYKEGVNLLPLEDSYVPIFATYPQDKFLQYKFNDPNNIPIFKKYSGIDKEEDWNTFLNKLVFVTGPSNLDCAETIVEEMIEDILPKSTDKIWNKLYKIVDFGLKNRAEITSEQISKLFETVEEEIQEGHENKYEKCKLEFICYLPVYQFLTSKLYSTLPIVSTNPEFTLIKVCKVLKKLRQEKLAQESDLKKYILKHVYSIKEVKDIRNVSTCNLLIITINNSDQLDMFEILKNDNQKYIIIISNDINVSGIRNYYQLYRDEDHSFKLLTDKSKQDVLDEQCVSLNGRKFSFSEILDVNSSSLTQQQVERLNSVVTEDVLICFFKHEYETLKLNFNREGINQTGVYIKRRLVYTAAIEESKIEKFTEECVIDDLRNFKSLCEQKPNDNLHYFIKRKNHLLWVQTNGDTKYLKQFINEHRTNDFVITEDELCRVDANTMLISDKPGMGKSTLISSVFNELEKESPEQIIIRLNFNDHTNSFSKEDLNFNSFEKTVDFIINELLTKAKLSKLSQNVHHYIFQSQYKIFFFLDGFDEICPDYNDTVVSFIQSVIKYTSCKLFITTRPGQTDTLERVLLTFALSIQPFTKKDIQSYLEQTLGSNYINNNSLLEKINEYSEFLGVPLLLKIVAETLSDENDDKLNIDTIFNLSLLFKTFINQKFVIYSAEKKNQDNTKTASQEDNKRIQEGYEKEHEELALRLLFSKKTETQKQINYEQITKIGIITQVNNERIEFIHRTFAEYFVATHVQKHFNEDRVIKLLLTDVLVENDLTPLRQFINNYIGEKISNVKTIDKYRRYVNDNYKNIDEDNLVLSILHTAADENNSEIATFILECFKQSQNMLDSIMSYERIHTALHTAILLSKIETAKQIINYCDKNKMNKQCKAYKFTFGKGDEDRWSALHMAASKGHTEVVSLLLAKGASVNILDTDGWTPLHWAASKGRTEVVSLLLAKGASVDIDNTVGWTALHVAARQGHTEIVSLLLAKGASVDMANTDGWTPLHMAVIVGNTEMVSLLLAKGASVDMANTDSWTPLHMAAWLEHAETVQQLIDHGADVNIIDNTGLTALQLAIQKNHTGTVKVLQSRTKTSQ